MADNSTGVSITISANLTLEELADVLVEELDTDSLLELFEAIEQRSEEGFVENLRQRLKEE